jgi:regulator of CtrA degradation
LIAESFRLHDRITRLERILGDSPGRADKSISPIDGHIERLRMEFPAA